MSAEGTYNANDNIDLSKFIATPATNRVTTQPKPLSSAPVTLRGLADQSNDIGFQRDLRHWANVIEKLCDGLVGSAIDFYAKEASDER